MYNDEHPEIKAWMHPVLISFVGAKRTSTTPEMIRELEGTVGWGVDLINDAEPVTDKFGVVHEPYPLVRGTVSKPAPDPVARVSKTHFDDRDWQSIEPIGNSLDSLVHGTNLYAEPLIHPDTVIDAFLKNTPRLHAELLRRGYPRHLALHIAGANDYDELKAQAALPNPNVVTALDQLQDEWTQTKVVIHQTVGVLQDELKALHLKLAGETLRADRGWERYENKNKYAMQLETELMELKKT